MKKLSKISLKSLSDVMTDREMKLVTGGNAYLEGDKGVKPCDGKKEGAACTYNGKKGTCEYTILCGLCCNTLRGSW
jgi:natural product precursor